MAAAAAHAQPVGADAAARSFALSAGLSLDSSLLETRGRAQGNGAEALVSLSPSLTLVQRSGYLQGSLAYSGSLVNRRGIADRAGTDYFNTLSANYSLEAIRGLGYVDARASVSQQTISAVGAPAGSSESSNSNRNEVRTFALSPYLRGELAGVVDYELRTAGSATRGAQDASGDSNALQTSFYLRSPPRGGLFGWGLSGSHNRVEFATSTVPTTNDRLIAELSMRPDIDWRLSVNGGQERTDVVGAQRQKYENYGASVQWTPSPRTTVLLQGEQRYFGRGHTVTVEHRLARSTFHLSSTRDVAAGSDPLSQGQAVTLYAFFFAQFAQAIPDPVQRDQFVLSLIAAIGRGRDELVGGGLFATGGVSVQQRRDLSWVWAGSRLTISATGFTVDTERVDSSGANLAGGNDNIRQSGYAASLGWRLTPLTSVNASGSRTMTQETVSLARSDLKSASLGLATQLGRRTTGALSARYSVFNGSTESYRETAVTGSLSLRF